MSLLAIALASALAAQPVTRVDGAVALSGWSRSELPGEAQGVEGVTLTPDLTAKWLWRDLDLVTEYAPRLSALWAGGEQRATMQGGQLSVRWTPTRRLTLEAVASGHFGRNEMQLDPGAKSPFDGFDAVAPVISDWLDGHAAISGSYRWDPRTRIDGSLGYDAYGGLSVASQQRIPFQQGPSLYLGGEQAQSRSLSLIASLYLSDTWDSSGRRTDLARLDAGAMQDLSPNWSVRGAVGASVDGSRDRTGGRSSEFWPVMRGELDGRLSGGATASSVMIVGAIAPHHDPFTGQLFQRAELSGAYRAIFRERLTARVRAGWAKALGVDAPSFALAEADLGYQLPRGFSLLLGAQSFVRSAAPGTRPLNWLVFTSAAYALPDLL
jgi:hypothetical protein